VATVHVGHATQGLGGSTSQTKIDGNVGSAADTFASADTEGEDGCNAVVGVRECVVDGLLTPTEEDAATEADAATVASVQKTKDLRLCLVCDIALVRADIDEDGTTALAEAL